MAKSKREALLERAKAGVKQAYSKKDLLVMQAVRSLTDLDEAASLLYTRLDEWFKLNFPEFSVEDAEKASALIAAFGAKEQFEKTKAAAVLGADATADALARAAKASYGPAFSDEDRKAVQALARHVHGLFESRREIEAYITDLAGTTLKNLSHLTDALTAARLVTEAGGLQRLAEMPASTIQVIGAEKALFKHLRSGTRPPKHGVIFQSTFIRNAPLDQRGRIARTLAAKLSIAAKADYYTGRFIADALKADLEERLKAIAGTPKGPAQTTLPRGQPVPRQGPRSDGPGGRRSFGAPRRH